jgi:hypothetical protein
MELLFVLVVVVLVVVMIAKVTAGTWGSTWAGSGYERDGQKIPGVRPADPVTASTAESPPMPAIW